MKQQITVFDSETLHYVIITKNTTRDLIKDFDIYFRGNTQGFVLAFLRQFSDKTITYSRLLENLVKDAPRLRSEVLRYSRVRFLPEKNNVTRNAQKLLSFLVREHGGDWGKINWHGFKRTQRKKDKKKESV